MTLYVTQLHAGDWYIDAKTGSPRDERDFAYRAPPFDTRAQAVAHMATFDPFRSELTPTGEQLVIPGCERNLAPERRQLDLFG